MNINKDLVDACMMLSGISLVLVGTTDFSEGGHKTIIMATLAVIAVLMLVFRIIAGSHKHGEHNETYS